jgi:hypothetical protein
LEDIIEEILGTEIEDETDSVDGGDVSGGFLKSTTATLRDMDLARLKSLRRKITDDKLSEDEVQAIVNCIEKQVPAFPEILRREYPTTSLPQIVKDSGVLTMKRKTPEGEKPHPDDFLIRRGKMTNSCILILQGRVRVFRKDSNTNSSGQRKRQYSTNDPENVNNELESSRALLDGSSLHDADAISLRNESTDNLTELSATAPSFQEVIRGPWSLIGENALLQDEGTYIPDFSVVIDSDDIRFVRITMFTSMRLTQATEGLSTIERKRRDALRRLHAFNLPLPAMPTQLLTSSNSLRRTHTIHDTSDLYYDDLPQDSAQNKNTITEESGSKPSSSPSESSLRMQRFEVKNPMIPKGIPVSISGKPSATNATAAANGDEEEGFSGARSYSESEASQYLQDYYNNRNSATSNSINRKSFMESSARKKF